MMFSEHPVISAGGHHRPGEGVCLMELVSLLAGEQFTDHPACASRFITTIAIAVNDVIPDDGERTRWLAPIAPLIVNTRGGAEIESYRAMLTADAIARRIAPLLVQSMSLPADAAALRRLAPIRDRESATAAIALLEHVEQKLATETAASLNAAASLIRGDGEASVMLCASQAARTIRTAAYALAVLGRADARGALWGEAAMLLRSLALATGAYVAGAPRPSFAHNSSSSRRVAPALRR